MAVGYQGVGLYLDEDLGGYEAADLDHAGGWPYKAEELRVGPSDDLPFVDVNDEDPGPHHVREVGPGGLERDLQVTQSLDRLRPRVPHPDEAAAPRARRGPRSPGRALPVPQSLARLRPRAPPPDEAAAPIGGRRPRDVHEGPT